MVNNRKVLLKALVGKYKFAPFYAVPHQDSKSGKYLTGIENVPKEFIDPSYAISKDDIVPITHSMLLDMQNTEHVNKYHFFLVLDEVANRLEEAIPGKHIFYIEDAESEAAISVDKDELMIQAFELISSNMSEEKLYNIAFFLSKDPRGMSSNLLKQMVYSEAKTNPAGIIRAMGKGGKHQIFVSKLFFAQIIKKQKNMYFYGDTLLGISLEETVLFMMNPANNKLVDVLGQQLALKEGKPLEAGDAKLELTMPDGTVKEVTEDEADKLMLEYSMSVPPSYGIKGKVKKLQTQFDLIRNKD
ncbi:MAG: hypothetical protein DRP97_00990 [Candidatus Latescibacterota bacterium]|nr:MAG: hypothetical protein DRP97_00990 [Candidatus Latescibacterota bacterium]